MRRKWHTVAHVDLDTRSAAKKRVNEMMLAGMVGRTRPMMYGERTPEVMRRIVMECSARLPWESDDWSDES
jgi:hypothetical protein